MLFCIFLLLNLLAVFILARYALCVYWDGGFYGITHEIYIEKNINGVTLSTLIAILQTTIFLMSFCIGQNVIKSLILVGFTLMSIAFGCLFVKNLKKAKKTQTQTFLNRCEEIKDKYAGYINEVYFLYWITENINSEDFDYVKAMAYLERYKKDMDKKLQKPK